MPRESYLGKENSETNGNYILYEQNSFTFNENKLLTWSHREKSFYYFKIDIDVCTTYKLRDIVRIVQFIEYSKCCKSFRDGFNKFCRIFLKQHKWEEHLL